MGNRKLSRGLFSYRLWVGVQQAWRTGVLSCHDQLHSSMMRRIALRRILLSLMLISIASHPTLSLSEELPRTIFFKQFAPGLLARTVYTAQGSALYRVEMWDLLVGPGRKTASVSLPGGAVLEIRSGAGRVIIDGQPRDVRMGSTLAINEGSQFSINNGQEDRPLSIRAIVIPSQQE
jgi:hypothetical protein